MKKAIAFLLLASCLCGLFGCARSSVSDAKVSYGNSSVYSRKDMDSAVEQIKKEFCTWDGFELHSVAYSSDDECNSSENVAWMNELARANGLTADFTQCIMFTSSFHTPEDGGGSLNGNQEYTGWHWWLARADGGDWMLMTWGY